MSDALHQLADRMRLGIQQQHRRSILERAGQATITYGIEPETPFRTGKLQKGNVLEVQSLGDYARIHNIMDYAPFVEYGRKPIEAAPGKVLRFEIGGQVLYRKRVKGVAPNRFYERGAARSAQARQQAAAEVGAQILAAIGGRS